MRRGLSAISCAALVAAALLSGCGGGHGSHTSSSTVRPQTSVTTSPTSATTQTVTQAVAGAYWPYAKLVGHLAGMTVSLPGGMVHLQSTLLECNGEGAPVKTGTTPRWSHYTCTQTLFQNGADRDVTFDVTLLNATRLTITNVRYGPE